MDEPRETEASATSQEAGEAASRHRAALEAAWKSARPAWIALADTAWQLDRVIDRVTPSLDAAEEAEALAAMRVMSKRLHREIAEGGVECVCPEGQPYTPDLANLLESVAREERTGISGPMVLEVVEPAITLHGTLIRGGRIIVALPASGQESRPQPSDMEGS
jgi:hypothetical protein